MALTDLQKRAKKLGVEFTDETTEEVLLDLVKAAEDAAEQSKKEAEIAKKQAEQNAKDKKKEKLVLKNILGEDVDEKDYFFGGLVEDPITKEKKMMYAPTYFNRTCGMPVDAEDLIEVFREVFKDAAEDYLFYKVNRQEVYIIIVPLAKATVVGHAEDSLPGDFQKHAMSFIAEGSVNIDTMKLKLRKIASFLKRSE